MDEPDPAEPDQQATTTATKDFMGRALLTPMIDSRDYLGRNTFSAVDYMGRTLVL